MALNRCGVFCKYILILLNLIFAVLGFGFLGLGLWLRFSISNTFIFVVGGPISDAFFVGVTVMIVFGLVMLIAVMVGDYGACREKRSALLVFSVLVGILAVAEGVVGFLAYSWLDKAGISIAESCISSREQDTSLKDMCYHASLVMGIFLGTGALLIVALICSAVLSSIIRSSVSSPQYIVLTHTAPVLTNPQPPQQELSTFCYPHPDQDPVVFPPLTLANIPAAQAKCISLQADCR